MLVSGAVDINGYYPWGRNHRLAFLGRADIPVLWKELGCVGVKLARGRIAVNRLAGNDQLELQHQFELVQDGDFLQFVQYRKPSERDSRHIGHPVRLIIVAHPMTCSILPLLSVRLQMCCRNGVIMLLGVSFALFLGTNQS